MGKRSRKQRIIPKGDHLAGLPESMLDRIFYFDPDREALFSEREHRAASDAASEDDRQWFEAHPKAKARVRPCVFGEIPTPHREYPVLVRQIKPGMRMREPLIQGWQPFVYLRIGKDGEVVGRYTEFEGWQDATFNKIKQMVEDIGEQSPEEPQP